MQTVRGHVHRILIFALLAAAALLLALALLAYLRGRVPQMTRNRQTPTCPLLYDFGEAFLLARAR